jgi:hypothetical protein
MTQKNQACILLPTPALNRCDPHDRIDNHTCKVWEAEIIDSKNLNEKKNKKERRKKKREEETISKQMKIYNACIEEREEGKRLKKKILSHKQEHQHTMQKTNEV